MELEKLSEEKHRLLKEELTKFQILVGGLMMVHLVNKLQHMIVKFG